MEELITFEPYEHPLPPVLKPSETDAPTDRQLLTIADLSDSLGLKAKKVETYDEAHSEINRLAALKKQNNQL